MTDEEALKRLDLSKARLMCTPDDEWTVAYNALREKVAASKPKRPTLEEMERVVGVSDDGECHSCGHEFGPFCCDARRSGLIAATDVLKALREKVVPWLKSHNGPCLASRDGGPCIGRYTDYAGLSGTNLLRALGEDVQP